MPLEAPTTTLWAEIAGSDSPPPLVAVTISGRPTLVIDGEDHPVRIGSFARLDPMHSRTVRNGGEEPASVLIASAPRSSGYEPMDWA
jgi:hypothetical protein